VKLSLFANKGSSAVGTEEEQQLISDTLLRLIIGGLWFLDGLLQLQPGMFTMNMVNGIMQPAAQGQPAPIAASLNWIIDFTSTHLTIINLCIALVQLAIGACLLSGRWVKSAIIASILWALMVWYAGEGMSLLLTGQASILTGAPGAVLLYPLVALVIYPRKKADGTQTTLLSRLWLRRIFALFWLGAALLQLQPYWWQSGQISQQSSGMLSPGTLSGIIVDPLLKWFAHISAGIEIPLNLAFIIVCLALAAGLFFARPEQLRPWLIASMVVSILVWCFGEALGMVLTGMGTDPNTGPLLVLMALICWPGIQSASSRVVQEERKSDSSSAAAPSQL
jgi:hypothetical protein